MLGSRTFVDTLLRDKVLHEKITLSLALSGLIDRVSSVLHVEPEALRRPSKARSLAEKRGLIYYCAIRELGYKGQELGKELRLGPVGMFYNFSIEQESRADLTPWLH